jgi:hypothetical protein
MVSEQTDSLYPYAVAYEQEKGLHASHQENLSNQQWYEELCMLPQQGGAENRNFKMDPRDDHAKNEDNYPKNRQATVECENGEGEEDGTKQAHFTLLNCGATFNQSHGAHVPLVLRDVILLDSCSTMDLFCNPKFVQDIVEVPNHITVESNGGKLKVRHKAKVSDYNALVYYDSSAIANILSLKNLGKQYPITYDSAEMMFVVHREAQGKPDMHFVMHSSGLHYWVPDTTATALVTTSETALVATVADNMKNYTKRQIQGAE